jgi:hypothetical protein
LKGQSYKYWEISGKKGCRNALKTPDKAMIAKVKMCQKSSAKLFFYFFGETAPKAIFALPLSKVNSWLTVFDG